MQENLLLESRRISQKNTYPNWFFIPTIIIYGLFFLLPTLSSFYFAFTRWDLFTSTFIGWENFQQFFSEPQLWKSLLNTGIYAIVTSGLKVVLGLFFAVVLTSEIYARNYLRSVIFFPVLVSTVGVGITFTVLMHPTQGAINEFIAFFGIKGPKWLSSPSLALISVALVDVWKGVGLATLIYIAGIVSIPTDFYEAARMDGATNTQRFWKITVPLVRPTINTIIILSFIGGLRTFDLIWTMTKGGPGFSSDVIASVIYKQYQAGFYGLSTAGNVVLFLIVALLVFPIRYFMSSKEHKE